jgi:hypothetical protein
MKLVRPIRDGNKDPVRGTAPSASIDLIMVSLWATAHRLYLFVISDDPMTIHACQKTGAPVSRVTP